MLFIVLDSYKRNRYMFICFYCYIFVSKGDNDCVICELELLNLAVFHFETY